MPSLVTVAEHLIFEKLLSRSVAEVSRRSRIGEDILYLSGFFILVGAGLMAYALYLWLKTRYSPEIVVALMGCVFMGLAVLVGLISLAIRWARKQALQKIKRDMRGILEEGLEYAHEVLAEPVQDNPKTSALLAAIAGFITSENFL